MDQTLALPSGGSVRVRGFVVWRTENRVTLMVVTQERAASTDNPQALARALEIAQVYDEAARMMNATHISIVMCDREEDIQAERFGPPSFSLRRENDDWQPDPEFSPRS